MTCREKLKLEFPECVNAEYAGGCDGCPSDYGYRADPDYCDGCDEEVCTKCWDREVPDTQVNRLEEIIHSYALQYGTVIDQRKTIERIERKVANEIINAIAAVTESEICECTDWHYQCGYHKAMSMILGKLIELKEKYDCERK
jgi:hypothetical protein